MDDHNEKDLQLLICAPICSHLVLVFIDIVGKKIYSREGKETVPTSALLRHYMHYFNAGTQCENRRDACDAVSCRNKFTSASCEPVSREQYMCTCPLNAQGDKCDYCEYYYYILITFGQWQFLHFAPSFWTMANSKTKALKNLNFC